MEKIKTIIKIKLLNKISIVVPLKIFEIKDVMPIEAVTNVNNVDKIIILIFSVII